MTTRTLTGLDALGYAILRDLKTLRLDGVEVSVADARVASYDLPEAVTVEAELGPRGWTEATLEKWARGSGSARRATRTDERSRRLASDEEYRAAAALAREERALWDADTARLEAAGWRPSRYEVGCYYRLGSDGKARRDASGKVSVVSRRDALAGL